MNNNESFLGILMWVSSAIVSIVLEEPFVMVPPVVGTFFLFLSAIKE